MDPKEGRAPRERISFLPLAQALGGLDRGRLLVVTEPRLSRILSPALEGCRVLLVPEGEPAKSWGGLEALLGGFMAAGADRSWTVLSIGGGSVSDLAGLAAHLWMRGLGFSCAPTTLLSMVDAALGGKNAIDFRGYKNVLGSIQRPRDIFCDVSLLRSLPLEQFLSGLAEAVKHAVIDGPAHVSLLESALAEGGGPGAFSPASLSERSLERLVTESQRVKLDIVDADPAEKGPRRILNLGHSFGHPIEIEMGLPHGFAVSLGMVLALDFAASRGMADQADAARILSLLRGFGLPVDLGFLRDRSARARISAALAMDKKREGGILHFVVPRAIGRVEVLPLKAAELAAFLEERRS